MNFEEILVHHLLDHKHHLLFKLGPVEFWWSKHLMFLWIAAGVTTALLAFAVHGKGTIAKMLRGAVESIVLYLRDEMLHPVFHDATDTYLPYFLSLFFFILVANLIGLIPQASAVTANISVTAGLALCTFGLMQVAGAMEQGPWAYFVHIVPGGVPWWLWPMLLVIEVMGMFAKCIALCIRLFANIISGHIVALAFLSLIFIFAAIAQWIGLAVAPAAVGLALFVSALDVLVSLLQAYIFTMLTCIFVGGAVHPH
jgi:F-type H+-transporting ATPase subunit a